MLKSGTPNSDRHGKWTASFRTFYIWGERKSCYQNRLSSHPCFSRFLVSSWFRFAHLSSFLWFPLHHHLFIPFLYFLPSSLHALTVLTGNQANIVINNMYTHNTCLDVIFHLKVSIICLVRSSWVWRDCLSFLILFYLTLTALLVFIPSSS